MKQLIYYLVFICAGLFFAFNVEYKPPKQHTEVAVPAPEPLSPGCKTGHGLLFFIMSNDHMVEFYSGEYIVVSHIVYERTVFGMSPKKKIIVFAEYGDGVYCNITSGEPV